MRKVMKIINLDIWLNIAAMILASAFGSLLHFFALLVIPWFQWDEILAVLMMPGLVTHVVAVLMIM